MNKDNANILIIGMSKMGKTHFGGQLYGRLKNLENKFKLRNTPNDLSLFENVLDRLNEGLEGDHTSSQLHETIILPIKSAKGVNIDIVYPDYGGEQIRDIVEQRKLSKVWQTQIQDSNHWFLFVRLDLMENISDVTTKFYKQIEAEKMEKEALIDPLIKLPENSSAFYVELLQILLYAKRVSLSSINKPSLTIILSCADKTKSDKLPSETLLDKMPLFANFVKNIWEQDQLQIIGLSSLGYDLDQKNPNIDYQLEGPENFGYLILPNGEKEKDLTQILNHVVK